VHSTVDDVPLKNIAANNLGIFAIDTPFTIMNILITGKMADLAATTDNMTGI